MLCRYFAGVVKEGPLSNLDLMKRQPELVKEMVKIEGVFGNWYLDPDDPAIKNRDNLDFFEEKIPLQINKFKDTPLFPSSMHSS